MAPDDPDAAVGDDFVLIHGLRRTRGALGRWSADPGPVLSGWFAGAFAVSVTLLTAVWAVSLLSTPDSTPFFLPGISRQGEVRDYGYVLANNFLVLALHATACVAGFIAGSSLPLAAEQMSGLRRWVHEKAGPLAIAWVVLVTTFSLVAQAFALGFDGATLSEQLRIEPWLLVVSVLPHALIELTAVFLPLAAWLIASRRDEWEDLLAATFVTVAIAVPMLLVSAAIEIIVWPEILRAISPVL